MIRNFSTSSRWKSANCSRKYQFPGDNIPIVKGCALKALEGDAEAGSRHPWRSWTRSTTTFPLPERPSRQALPDAGRRRVHHRRSRHRRHRSCRARHPQEDGRSRNRRPQGHHARRPSTDIEMFRKLLDEAQRGRQRRPPAPRHQERRRRARPGHRQARLDQAAQEVQGGSLRAFARTKAAVTRRSSPTTARSSTSARRT